MLVAMLLVVYTLRIIYIHITPLGVRHNFYFLAVLAKTRTTNGTSYKHAKAKTTILATDFIL